MKESSRCFSFNNGSCITKVWDMLELYRRPKLCCGDMGSDLSSTIYWLNDRSGRGLWRIMLKGWESLETSSSLPQSIRSGSIHLRMTPRRLGVLKLSSGGFYLDTKNVLLNLYQLCCSSSCGFNFVLLSVMFLISLGQVFTKTSKNILKWL